MLVHGNIGAFYIPKHSSVRLGEIIVPDSESSALDFSSTCDFSIEFWIRTLNHGFPVLHKADDTGGYYIDISPAGRVVFTIASGDRKISKEGKEYVANGNWQHIVCVRNHIFGIEIFVNGIQEGFVESNGVSSLANSSPLIIGGYKEGVFDLVLLRIYQTNLKEKQIQSLYNMAMPQELEDNVRAEWYFEDRGEGIHDDGKNVCCGRMKTGEKVGTGNFVTEELFYDKPTTESHLQYTNIDIARVRIEDRHLRRNEYSFSPEGTVRYAKPLVGEVAIDYFYYPIMMQVGGFSNWFVDYVKRVAPAGKREGHRTYRSLETDWEIRANTFWITFREKVFPGRKFWVKLFDDAKGYLSTWVNAPASIGPRTERNELVERTIRFKGNGMILYERSKDNG